MTYAPLAALTVLAGILRFSTLGVQSYWGDEGFTVEIVRYPFGGILHAVRATESTPPLYYYLAWAWRHLFGTGPVGLRSLSALLGTLLVPVCFAVAAELFSRRAAFITAALVTFSPLLVWYSQEARAYSLLALLGMVSVWCCVRALRGERWMLWSWGVCSALALATHYFAIFVVAPEAVWLLARGRRDWRRWAAVAIPIAMAAVLVPLLIYQDDHVARPWTTGYSVLDGVTGTVQEALVGPVWTPITHRLATAVLALLAAVALVWLARDRDQRRRALIPAVLVAALIGIPLAGALVATNYLVIRNVIVAVPLGCMLVAAGCDSVIGRRGPAGTTLAGGVCVVGLAIVIAVPLTKRLQRNDWRDAVGTLTRLQTPQAWVFLDRFDSTPISRVYLPAGRPLDGTPVGTATIDFVGRVGYPGTLGAPTVPGFRLVLRRTFSGVIVSRWSAARPVPVTSRDFAAFDARVVTTR